MPTATVGQGMGQEDGFTPVVGVDPEPVETLELDDPAALVSLMQPPRNELLVRLIKTPATAAELAEALGAPVTRVYYHLGLLEEHGAIHVVATRRVRGVDERRYRATARSYRLHPDVIEQAREHPELLDDVVEAMFASARAQLRGVAARDAIGSERRRVLAHSQLELTPARRAEFIERLVGLMEEFGDFEPGPDEEVERYGLLVAAYPLTPTF